MYIIIYTFYMIVYPEYDIKSNALLGEGEGEGAGVPLDVTAACGGRD